MLTTPKLTGQVAPAIVVDGYEETRATGQEAVDRKAGVYKRERPGDDDDAY